MREIKEAETIPKHWRSSRAAFKKTWKIRNLHVSSKEEHFGKCIIQYLLELERGYFLQDRVQLTKAGQGRHITMDDSRGVLWGAGRMETDIPTRHRVLRSLIQSHNRGLNSKPWKIFLRI